MKLKSIIISIIIISPLILSSYSLGQNTNIQKNYVNFIEIPNGDILNLSYNNEIIINSIFIFPHMHGYWSEKGYQKQYLSKNLSEKIIEAKSPIIDIQSSGNVTIKIFFNNFSISKAISFKGFLINIVNGVGFINGGDFNILNSSIVINSTNNLSIKIFLENNESIGQFSQYIQSTEFDGIVYLNGNNSTSEFINESLGISSLIINGRTLSMKLINNASGGFIILDLMGYEKPLNITINGFTFKNTTVSNVTNESYNSYAISNVNGSYVYLIYLSSIFKNSSQPYNSYEYVLITISAILIILLASLITLRKMVKK